MVRLLLIERPSCVFTVKFNEAHRTKIRIARIRYGSVAGLDGRIDSTRVERLFKRSSLTIKRFHVKHY